MASKLWFLKTPSSGREVYCNVVATKNFKSTKPYLVMKQQQQRIITFIDYYYDYTFSDVNVECKYFILMLDQLFGAQPLQKQTNPKKWPQHKMANSRGLVISECGIFVFSKLGGLTRHKIPSRWLEHKKTLRTNENPVLTSATQS